MCTVCWVPRAKGARGKVLGALPRTPARGTPRGRPPETPAPFPWDTKLPERSSPSRVRCAAQTPRALDRSGPFRTPHFDKGKGAHANAERYGLPLVGPGASPHTGQPTIDFSLDSRSLLMEDATVRERCPSGSLRLG